MARTRRRRAHRKQVAEINVVPYIDVMLVLLVIFMITAPMLTQGVDVELPNANAAPIQQEETDVLIASVDKSGQYFIDIGGEQSPISLADLQTRVKKVLSQNPNIPVLVRGDKNVSYGEVIGLMVSLQGAGVPNVGLVTEPE
ncbi:protein TolR [Marinomonas mediterranea]|jgi:Cell division and transport-associated protein TolR (TC 2.C.1.2.1)|uniref:Tol-Pal system protein TolR n=1 Tax=Marinomonas mediterranea (strain ATCC 700492 / JCM 21426 / NBRC 103028 / MMB-1) TaxID=717774 RepID=F2K2T8_MARM1|nr:protein TolR [Marinomonas mediterranea]ADZ91221.1 protein TolR [Marinomonas mediterranea MMB-1]WCN09196.1 protein TolR [Marinomonas mediterranea]WCN13279.1 protein TolR [Marinomonas mediterranea]WCN17347.1 protein TolR [Marinomonas mediterranea MMB-1]